MNTISVSSYSLREQLGPIAAAYRADDGTEGVFRQDFPHLMKIGDFPVHVAEKTAATAVETVAFQFDGVHDREIDRFADNARRVGLDLLNAAVDAGDLLDADADRRAADVAEIKLWIDRLAAAGFRHVRVNAGSPFSTRRFATPPPYLIDALTELGVHARSRGVRLLIENHGGPSSDPAWVTALLGAVGETNIGLLLDTGNFDAILAPMMTALLSPNGTTAPSLDSLDLTSVHESLDALAPHAEIVHVKAHWATETGLTGPVDVDAVIAVLAAHGSDAPWTVEYEGHGGDPWAKVTAIIARLSRAEG